MFPLVFYVENLFPVFWCTPSHAMSQRKSVFVLEHQCVCSYSYLYYLHEYKLCPCARTTTLEAGEAATRGAAVWRFLAQ